MLQLYVVCMYVTFAVMYILQQFGDSEQTKHGKRPVVNLGKSSINGGCIFVNNNSVMGNGSLGFFPKSAHAER